MSLSPTIFAAPLINLVAGALIRTGTGGDKTKEAARASELAAIATAITQINSGQPGGVASLQAALQTSALDPAEALALQNLAATLATQVQAAATLGGGTILGQAQTAIFNNIQQVIIQTCAAYIPATPAAKV